MNVSKFLVATLMVGVLGLNTGCGVAKDVKNANNMEKEGNGLAASINAEQRALALEGVNVSSTDTETFPQWKNRSKEKRAELRARLAKLDLQLIRYIEIASHKDFEKNNGGAKVRAQQAQAGVRAHMKALDKVDETKT
jgi:hypothetical protein